MFGTKVFLLPRPRNCLKQIIYYYSCAFAIYLMVCAAFIYYKYDHTLPKECIRYNLFRTAQNEFSKTWWPFVLQFALHAVDQQADVEAEQAYPSRPVDEKDPERQSHSEYVVSEKSEIGIGPSTATPQSTTSHDIEAQGQRRKFRKWSSEQVLRKITTACVLMIGGLTFGPVVLYIAQRLFLPCCVDEIRTNIQSDGLWFWSFLLIAVLGYNTIMEKRKQRKERKFMTDLQQNARAPSREILEKEAGQRG